MAFFEFPLTELPEETNALRTEVRAFLADRLKGYPPVRRARSWMCHDAAFSAALGQAGFIGMTLPKRYGGHERSALERYVVSEELLIAGAPVAAHWISDRQSAPQLMRFGTEDQRRKLLPPIVRGELFFCIGMSEPNSGSDLASIRTRAVKTPEGWRISGAKLWTTYAHKAHMMILLARSADDPKNRHAGMTQFLVELDRPGISIRPILNLAGEDEFNEVSFDDVLLPHDSLLGQEGNGWAQVTGELAFERSGPERYLSSIQLFLQFLHLVGPNPSEAERLLIGRATAEIWTLRQMSLSVAGLLAKGADPALVATVVKDLGTGFEQELPRAVQALIDDRAATNRDFRDVLAYLLQASVAFSLRGGTREILRGMIARGLGLR